MKTQPFRYQGGLRTVLIFLVLLLGVKASLRAHPEPSPAESPVTNSIPLTAVKSPAYYKMVEDLRKVRISGEPFDEALGGKTLKGTPITPRIPMCFPAESRDLFWQMDMVSAGNNAPLQPLNFDANGNGVIDDQERNAIRGRNTWMLWAGGNEGFWNWLVQDGYGITDFLILVDSRSRDSRFKRAGLINQPGYRSNSDPSRKILGLYLDQPVGADTPNSDLPEGYRSTGHVLTSPPWDREGRRSQPPANHSGYWNLVPDPFDETLAWQSSLFRPATNAVNKFADVVARLSKMGDGVDYTVYGFPSGVIGLRLFLNPDFFGEGPGPEKARKYWEERVEKTNDRYYTDNSIRKDPQLVRPFRVGMSCAFCHVGPHPLNPPKNPEAPDWANLSTTIGNQFWKPQAAFANLQDANSFLYHFLASQQPGTIDTSLVSSDHINNANTINAVFDIPARLERAKRNPPELQSPANVRVKSIEEGPAIVWKGDGTDLRHTPRVLLDGSDSIGAFGALARVYLNIGTFYEEWLRCHNAIIGFKPQRPFSLETCQSNSVYWQVNEKYRTDYLAAFFTSKYAPATNPPTPVAANPPCVAPHISTQPMKLISAKESDGKTPSKVAADYLAIDRPDQRIAGRKIWLGNCAICHSSRQPDDFALEFSHQASGASWQTQPAPTNEHYRLPADGSNWNAFKSSPAYAQYTNHLFALVEKSGRLDTDPLTDDHPFWKSNYLSTDIRVPITLVETPSGRALASNALTNNVWNNFSSTTYKQLPAVGQIQYFDPIRGTPGVFDAPGGGRGYYRPATHISLWATAPFLHNNGLGVYLDDPSVRGRLVQFSDSIRRMLWKDSRANPSLVLSAKEIEKLKVNDPVQDALFDSLVVRLGDLRHNSSGRGPADGDPGFIYRVPQDTWVEFPAAYARPLVEGLAGKFLTGVLSFWLWVVLALWFAYLAAKHKPRYFGITLLLLAILVAVAVALSGVSGGGTAVGALLMGASGLLKLSSTHWWILAIGLALFGVSFIQARPDCQNTARWLLGLLLLGLVYIVGMASKSFWATALALAVAVVIWYRARPTLEDFSRGFFLLLTVVTVLLGYVANRFINGRTILVIPIANVRIGPIDVKTGPIPRGTPVNLVMSLDPESKKLPRALVSMVLAMAEIKDKKLYGDAAWELFKERAGQPLMEASKCPDFVLDRGHLFGETLDSDRTKNDEAKEALIAFLKTL